MMYIILSILNVVTGNLASTESPESSFKALLESYQGDLISSGGFTGGVGGTHPPESSSTP